jgi:hypothetical protein
MTVEREQLEMDVLLVGAGAVDLGRARSALDLLDQVRAMTWRLLHPRA